MVEYLRNFQQMVGPANALLIPLVIGFVAGASLCAYVQRKEPPAPEPPAPESEAEQETAAMTHNWEKKDNRRAPRRNGRIIEVLIALPGETDFAQQGLVLNRSNGGLGIQSRVQYSPGTVLGVLPVGASKLTPWVEVEVRNCRKHGDGWELGVQFLKVPPYATMLMFG